MTVSIARVPDLNAFLAELKLLSGAHESVEHGMCVMEAVAFVAGEPHSDHPACTSPVITSFMVSWNDTLPNDAERDRLLKALVPRLVGTVGTPEQELARSWMAYDWLVRVHTPTWLELAGLHERARSLRSLAPLTNAELATAAFDLLNSARDEAYAAWDAAWDAARDAAWDAAGAAAWAAARDAAWDAARDAAWDAARDAAWDAAWDAAGAAAWAAARDAAGAAAWAAARDAAGAAATKKLAPTVAELQQSALELVERMIAVTAS